MIKIKDVEKSYQSAHVFKRRRTPIVKGVSFECPIWCDDCDYRRKW